MQSTRNGFSNPASGHTVGVGVPVTVHCKEGFSIPHGHHRAATCGDDTSFHECFGKKIY